MNSSLDAMIPELREFKIFENMSNSQIFDLCSESKFVSSNHRDVLFQFGDAADYFGIVLSGAYKLSKPSSVGSDVIVHFSTPGDVIAAFIMAQSKPIYPVSSIAMGPSRFLKIPKHIFIEKWKSHPDLIFRIQNLLSTRMSRLQDQMAMLKAPLNQKVASLLLTLLEKSPNQNDLDLPLPLTRKEIADNLGASVEAVIRIMSEWSKSGIIQTNDQYIRIIKPDKIIELLKI